MSHHSLSQTLAKALVLGVFIVSSDSTAIGGILLKRPTVQPVSDPLIQYDVTAVLQGFDKSNNPAHVTMQNGDFFEFKGLTIDIPPPAGPASRYFLDSGLSGVASDILFDVKATPEDATGHLYDVKWTFAFLNLPLTPLDVLPNQSLTIGHFQTLSANFPDNQVDNILQDIVASNTTFITQYHVDGVVQTQTGPLHFTAVPEPSIMVLALAGAVTAGSGHYYRRNKSARSA